MFKIVKNVESNKLWLLKDGYYHDYIRIVGNLFYRWRKYKA